MASVPTLENQMVITDPNVIIPYQIRKFARTPRSALPQFRDEIASLAYLVAKYGNNSNTLCGNIQSVLAATFMRVFPGSSVMVTVTPTMTSDITYDVDITVQVNINGKTYQSAYGPMTISNGQIVLSADTVTL